MPESEKNYQTFDETHVANSVDWVAAGAV